MTAPAAPPALCSAPLPEPHVMGPTWAKNPDGSWLLPEASLGLAIILWIHANLRLEGEPVRLTLEQMRFIMWMYAVVPEGQWGSGRFLYRDVVLQRMKGWGKDPLAAIIAAVEFVGPCRFGGWGADGMPIAEENGSAWVQITAVSRDQTKNTMTFFASLFSKQLIAKHAIDIGKEVIYAHGGARRIEVTSSSPRSIEGNRPTFVIRNETHHWITSNDGIELANVIRRNLGKIKGGQARALSITNAYRPGEKSVAEMQRTNYLEMTERRGETTTMYDSLEAPVGSTLVPDFTRWDEAGQPVRELHEDGTLVQPSLEVTREHLRRILTVVRGDAVWLDVDRLIEEILSGETSMEDSKRFYFNSISLGDDRAFDPEDIRVTADDELVQARRLGTVDPLRCSWTKVGPDEPVVMFGDGSKSEDSTGLIGCRLSDGYVFTIGVWQKPKGDRGRAWLAPRDEIDARVHEAFSRFNIVAFWFDPSHTKEDENEVRYWDTLIDRWHVEYADRLQYWAVQGGDRRSAIMWDMTSPVRQVDFVAAVQRFIDEIESHVFAHDGHPSLMDHLRNARNSLTQHGWSISKVSRSSTQKIDLAVCAIGARMLRRLVMIKGMEEETEARGWWAPVEL